MNAIWVRGVRRATLSASVILLIAVAVLSFGPPSASATDNGAWAIEPTRADGARSPRSNFLLAGSPGQSITDSATLKNLTDGPIRFRIYAADAVITDVDGAFGLRELGDEMDGLGAWIRLPAALREVTLDGGDSIDIPFEVRVPADADAGDHAGGIVALNLTPLRPSDSDVNVEVMRAVGVRTYLRVAGDAHVNLSLDLSMSADPSLLPGRGSVEVTYTVTNTGTIRTSPDATLLVRDGLGRRRIRNLELPELLPGTSTTRVEVIEDLNVIGRVTADLEVTADDITRSSRSQTTVVPWLLLVAALGVVLLIVWVFQRRRRSRRPNESTSPSPFPSEEVTAGVA